MLSLHFIFQFCLLSVGVGSFRVELGSSASLSTDANPIQVNALNFNVDSVSRPGFPQDLELIDKKAEQAFDTFLHKKGGVEILAEIPEMYRFANCEKCKYPKRSKTLTKICATTWKQFRFGLLVPYSIGFTGYIDKMTERQAWFTDMRDWSPGQFAKNFPKLGKKARLVSGVDDQYRGCWSVSGDPPEGLGWMENVEGKAPEKEDAKKLVQEGFTGFGPVDEEGFLRLMDGLAFRQGNNVLICNHYVAAYHLLKMRRFRCTSHLSTPVPHEQQTAVDELSKDPVSWLSSHIATPDVSQKKADIFRIVAFGEQPFSPLASSTFSPDIVALEELDFLDVGGAPFDTRSSEGSSSSLTFGQALEKVGFDLASFPRPVPADEVAILWRTSRFRLALDISGKPIPPKAISIDEDNAKLSKSKKKVAGIVALQPLHANKTDHRALLVVAAHLLPGEGREERIAQRSELQKIKQAIDNFKVAAAHLDFYVALLGDLNVDSLHLHEVADAEVGTCLGLADAHKTWYDSVPGGVDPYGSDRRATQSTGGGGGKRIDYIFLDRRATVVHASLPDPKVSVQKLPIEGKHPSDHVAVAVTFQIT